jgi:hypothetical protein
VIKSCLACLLPVNLVAQWKFRRYLLSNLVSSSTKRTVDAGTVVSSLVYRWAIVYRRECHDFTGSIFLKGTGGSYSPTRIILSTRRSSCNHPTASSPSSPSMEGTMTRINSLLPRKFSSCLRVRSSGKCSILLSVFLSYGSISCGKEDGGAMRK